MVNYKLKYDKTKYEKQTLETLRKKKREAVKEWYNIIMPNAGKEMTETQRDNWMNKSKSYQYILADLDDAIRDKKRGKRSLW